jgi:hypothetical protein
MSLGAINSKVRPIKVAAIEDYIVEHGLAHHPIKLTPQAYELAQKGNLKASMQASCSRI